MGIVPFGLDVPKKPVFMRVSGLGTFRVTVFATDEIVTLGLQLSLKNRIIFKASALLGAEAFYIFDKNSVLTYRQGGKNILNERNSLSISMKKS